MKITKFEHSCLLVEMPAPVNRTVLFDPGVMSEAALDVGALEYLDDIVITHAHPDHLSMKLVTRLVAAFPQVRITGPGEVVDQLSDEDIVASVDAPDGMELFSSPHEAVKPLFPQPQQIGVHYLDLLSHPGDSHSFHESKPVLALPVTAPWGSTITAVNLALALKPTYVIPIHDWHWSLEAREAMYKVIEEAFEPAGITLLKPTTGEPIVIKL